MKKKKFPLILALLLLMAAGGVYLAMVEIPAPVAPQEKVLNHADYIK